MTREFLLPKFYQLLHTAAQAASKVDNFDLHSDDQKSVTNFAELVTDSNKCSTELIDYCAKHQLKLLGII